MPKLLVGAQKKKTSAVVLLVTGVQNLAASPPNIAGIIMISRDKLAAVLTEFMHPAVIVSPLSANGFDAVEIARTLADCAYRGVYYAITQPLPAPQIIIEEVQRTAPGLVFDLLTEADLDLLKKTGLPE